MKRLLLVTSLCAYVPFAAWAQRANSAATPGTNGKPRAYAIFAPRPDYPLEARDRHLTGSGVAILDVDPKTGYVTAARLLKSTGHSILDNAALSAFVRWRFKPGTTAKQIKIPIDFSIHR